MALTLVEILVAEALEEALAVVPEEELYKLDSVLLKVMEPLISENQRVKTLKDMMNI